MKLSNPIAIGFENGMDTSFQTILLVFIPCSLFHLICLFIDGRNGQLIPPVIQRSQPVFNLLKLCGDEESHRNEQEILLINLCVDSWVLFLKILVYDN